MHGQHGLSPEIGLVRETPDGPMNRGTIGGRCADKGGKFICKDGRGRDLVRRSVAVESSLE